MSPITVTPTAGTLEGFLLRDYKGHHGLLRSYRKGRRSKARVSVKASNSLTVDNMIYDVNSPLFRSFLSQKGGSSDKRKMEEQKPKEQRPKANENKPVMTE